VEAAEAVAALVEQLAEAAGPVEGLLVEGQGLEELQGGQGQCCCQTMMEQLLMAALVQLGGH